MREENLLDYHIKETNKRLERIEEKLDQLTEIKTKYEQSSKNMAVGISMFISIVVAALSEWFKKASP